MTRHGLMSGSSVFPVIIFRSEQVYIFLKEYCEVTSTDGRIYILYEYYQRLLPPVLVGSECVSLPPPTTNAAAGTAQGCL